MLHVIEQVPAKQVAAPFGSAGQTVQEAPQPDGLSSRVQVAAHVW